MKLFVHTVSALALFAVVMLSNRAEAQVVPYTYSPPIAPTCQQCPGAVSGRALGGRQNCRHFTQEIRDLRRGRRECLRSKTRRPHGLGRCGRPQCAAPCPCQAAPALYIPPTVVPSTTVPPMALPTTTMVPRPVMTYKDITRTMVRKEAYRVTVPVTTYQQQVRYRDVPYQVTERVAQTEMRYVPAVAAVRPGCNSCQRGYAVQPATPMQPQTAVVPTLPRATPLNAQRTGLPTLAKPEPMSALTPANGIPMPTADPGFAPQSQSGQQWQTIKSRHNTAQQSVASTTSRQDGYRTLRNDYDSDIPQTASSTSKRFVRAPSAANVMRTQLR